MPAIRTDVAGGIVVYASSMASADVITAATALERELKLSVSGLTAFLQIPPSVPAVAAPTGSPDQLARDDPKSIFVLVGPP